MAADHWLTFNTLSLLGGALAGQGADPALTVAARIDKLREAEPLLLEAFEGLRASEEEIPAAYRETRLREALERIVQLYHAWHAAEPDAGHDARGASWRAELEQRLAESKAARSQEKEPESDFDNPNGG